MMINILKKDLTFLTLVCKSFPSQRRVLLSRLTSVQLQIIKKLVMILLRPGFPISKRLEKKLDKYQVYLRRFVSKETCDWRKRELIRRGGNAVTLIIRATLTFLIKENKLCLH